MEAHTILIGGSPADLHIPGNQREADFDTIGEDSFSHLDFDSTAQKWCGFYLVTAEGSGGAIRNAERTAFPQLATHSSSWTPACCCPKACLFEADSNNRAAESAPTGLEK
jgi:hypothetical protein